MTSNGCHGRDVSAVGALPRLLPVPLFERDFMGVFSPSTSARLVASMPGSVTMPPATRSSPGADVSGRHLSEDDDSIPAGMVRQLCAVPSSRPRKCRRHDSPGSTRDAALDSHVSATAARLRAVDRPRDARSHKMTRESQLDYRAVSVPSDSEDVVGRVRARRGLDRDEPGPGAWRYPETHG